MNYNRFDDVELQPMEAPEIYSFIDHWHNAVWEELGVDEEKAELKSLANHLKENVKRNRSIRNLATNPLLCAMLCALNRNRRRYLPTDRIELYEACCSLLLERRDRERNIELIDYPALNYRQKRHLLEDLAYWMIKNNWSELAPELVDERFDRKLKDIPSISQDITGAGVRRLFVERSGMIREPVVGEIDFTHRTFQEFLAAKAAADEMDIGVLVTNAHNDQWREVIILATGLATKQMRDELINRLIARGDTESVHRYQLHLLAVSCFETSVGIGQEVREEVEKRLSQLVPPKSMTDAQALASAGELAVKHLAKGKYSPAITAACIRTLAIIGSDDALEMLEGYANETRSTIVNELINSWDSFDRNIYAKHVLSQTFQNKSDLHLGHLTTLEGIQYFTNLISLNLAGDPINPPEFSDLSHLKDLTQLKSLNLSYCDQITDLTPLKELTQLVSLDLSGCSQVSNLSPLVSLSQLTSLDLSECSELNDLRPLKDLTQLKSLNLSYCNQITDLSPLKGLTQLVSLDLSGCSQVSDLTPIAGLHQLISLDISYHTYLSDLSALENLPQLRRLNLSHCPRVNDIRSLAELLQLTSLDLSGCFQVSDLSALMNLNNLKSLVISENLDKLFIPEKIKGSVYYQLKFDFT